VAAFFDARNDVVRSKEFQALCRIGRMVRFSTLVILAGIALLFVPIPPIATILGVLTIAIGIVMRLLG
jgi:small-conductance mechanosensitive channel